MSRTKKQYTLVYVGDSDELRHECFDDLAELKTRLGDLGPDDQAFLFGGAPITFGTEIVIGSKTPRKKAERKPREKKPAANGSAVGKALDATVVA